MNTPKPDRRYPFFVLAISLPLLLSLFQIVLPQFSVFELTKLEAIVTGYSAVLLSFFAGIRLGSKINKNQTQSVWLIPFFAGPALGFIVLMLNFSLGLAVLAVGFGALGAWDSWSAFKGALSGEYSAVRTNSTWLICVILILIFVLDGLSKSAL